MARYSIHSALMAATDVNFLLLAFLLQRCAAAVHAAFVRQVHCLYRCNFRTGHRWMLWPRKR